MRNIGFLQNNSHKKEVSTIVPIKFTHSCAIGETGCGKTTGYIYPNLDERIKHKHSILMYDYKGKEHSALKVIAKKYNRLDDVIEIGVPWGVSVNLIKYMNEAELREFVRGLTGLAEKDQYWADSAANITISIWKSLKAYFDVINLAKKVDDETFFLNMSEEKFPNELTFASISDVTKDQKSIVHFFESLQKLNDKFEVLFQKQVTSTSNDTLEKNKELYVLLMEKILALKQVIKYDIESLMVFKEAEASKNKSTTFQTMILSMSTTFATVSKLKSFNKDEFNLVEALNNGKIVVINTRELSPQALSSFTGSLLQELSKRVTKKDYTPLSIFIDEAQRVVDKHMDLYEDVLREAKIELFLAFQNHELMIEALGENNFLALYQNLTMKFNFRNTFSWKDLETDELKDFEYIVESTKDTHIAKTIFFEEEELFDVQQEYLKENDIYSKYGLESYEEEYIIVFNPHLYQENKFLLESRNQEQQAVEIQNTLLKNQAMKELQVLMQMKKEDSIDHSMKDGESILDLFERRLANLREDAEL